MRVTNQISSKSVNPQDGIDNKSLNSYGDIADVLEHRLAFALRVKDLNKDSNVSKYAKTDDECVQLDEDDWSKYLDN